MIIRDITIKELPAFMDSELYKGSRVIPVTPERAVSHVNNPRAQADDVVLIVAYTEEGRLAGFAGMLPDTGQSKEGLYRFAWNSGWWVDPQWGRGVALDLFFRSIQAWMGQYMIADLTPHTRKIVALTNLFYFTDPDNGVRFQILSDFAGKFRRKYSCSPVLTGLFACIDRCINSILHYRLRCWEKRTETEDIKIEDIPDFDSDCLRFIEEHSHDELSRRSEAEFRWIFSYPWLVKGSSATSRNQYPFSWKCMHFEYRRIKITARGEIAGIVMFTNREGLFKIPYAYYDPDRIHIFSRAVCRHLIDGKASGFLTSRRQLIDTMEKDAFPVFYTKSFIHEIAVSKDISQRRPEKYRVQEGDGDAVFT
jgi:hypothetical protein